MKRVATVMLLCLLPPLASATAIYRWVDSAGRTNFSERPPLGTKFEIVAEPPAPAPSPHLESLRELDVKQGAAREAAGKDATRTREAKAQAEERCGKARTRLEYLDQRPPGRIATTGPDGELRRLTEEEYEGRRASAQKDISENCN